jgi:glycerophosphoryl diester phosphodiesterase
MKLGDRIILASDGYPELFDTLEETERYLFQMLTKDPLCIHELRGTKGVRPGNQSFDDRSYISFRVGADTINFSGMQSSNVKK